MDSIFPADPDSDKIRTKICGVTTLEQAREISKIGADALGFNFWPKSKRYIDPLRSSWLGSVENVIKIGVFVNPAPEEIMILLEKGVVDWAQLHGDESPEMVRLLQDRGFNVFKATGVKDRSSLEKIGQFWGPILLDAYAPKEYGGSGEKMDWALGAEAVKKHPEREIILAGGLRPENVREAIEQVRPAAVDVASGVEASPGIKDLNLCLRFIEESRI